MKNFKPAPAVITPPRIVADAPSTPGLVDPFVTDYKPAQPGPADKVRIRRPENLGGRGVIRRVA